MKKIEKLYYMSRMVFLEYMAYTKGMWIDIAGNLVAIFIYYFLWKVVFQKTDQIAGFTAIEMTTYILLSKILASQFGKGINTMLSRWISNGNIAVELTRPVDLFTTLFTRRMGEFCAYIVFKALPVLAAGYLLLGGAPPASIVHLFLFFVSVLLSVGIMFYFEMLTGMASFYTLTHWSLGFTKQAVLDILSGGVVPLFLFPEAVARVLHLLPFAGMVSVPVYIFLGKYSIRQSIWYLGLEVFWVVVLWAIARAAYSRVVKRVVVQGG